MLLAALRHYTKCGWTVTLFLLPVGVRWSLLFEHWVLALEALDILKAKICVVLQQAAAASEGHAHTSSLQTQATSYSGDC